MKFHNFYYLLTFTSSSSSIEDSNNDSLELELESTTELTDDFGLRLLGFFAKSLGFFLVRFFRFSLSLELLFESPFFKSIGERNSSLP